MIGIQAISEKSDNQPKLSVISVSNEDNFHNDTFLKETVDASKNMKECLGLRDKYMFKEH